MTFADCDVVQVLEETLPARYGGGPISYQLVEQELPDGRAALQILVDPAIGPVDEAEVIQTFLGAIGDLSPREKVMAETWRAERLLTVERRAPGATVSGK